MPEINSPSPDAVKRIQSAVRKVEGQPVDLTGSRHHPMPQQAGFYAMIKLTMDAAAANVTGQGHSWDKVIPMPDGHFMSDPDGITGEGTAQNLCKCLCPAGVIVWLNFAGFVTVTDEDGTEHDTPHYVFSYGAQEFPSLGVPKHDHRDNVGNHGGFAFACLHPGTAIPAIPWAL